MFKKFVSIAMGSMLVFGSFSTVFAEDILASGQVTSKDEYKMEKGKEKNEDKRPNKSKEDKENKGKNEEDKGRDKEDIDKQKEERKEKQEEREDKKEERQEQRKIIEEEKDKLEDKKDSIEKEYEELKDKYEEALESENEELAEELKVKMNQLKEEWDDARSDFKDKLKEMKSINIQKYSKDELDKLKEKTKQLEKKGMKVLPVENIFSKKDNLKFEIPPVIKDGRTLIPVRAISEGFGADVEWDEEDRTIEITKDDTTIILNLEDETAIVDGEEIELDTKPEIISNRTVVPLRFIAETLGLKVNWDEDESTIEIEDDDEGLEIE